MLAKQTAIYFAANVFSALFGFVNVVIFTRLFAVDAYGDYVLGLGVAMLFATVLSCAIKLSILREQAKGDGTDVRGVSLAALVLCLIAAPFGYGIARLLTSGPPVAAASLALAFAIVLFETSLEILRAHQHAAAYMRGIVLRAILVSALGIASALLFKTGTLLLTSSALAFLISALCLWRTAWGASRPQFDFARLRSIAWAGIPLTVSVALLSISGLADRFLVALVMGTSAAGQFAASVDLVRQSLIIPAISVASAFVPTVVRLHATGTPREVRAHLEKCLELLLAIVLPACLGFAIVSPYIGDVVLGPNFRQFAHQTMPILSLSVVFQVLTQQYFHTSFLLSKRNVFYLVNTASTLLFNLPVAFLLISRYGIMGAVWARLAAEIFGFLSAIMLSRFAFEMPFPIATLARVGAGVAIMAAVLHAIESMGGLHGLTALAVLIPAGMAIYAAVSWLIDVADVRTVLRGLRLSAMRWASAP